MSASGGFRPPPYPYDRLDRLRGAAAAHPGGVVNLSVGTPIDPAPDMVIRALGSSGEEHGYPTSIGSARLRQAAVAWMARRLGTTVDPEAVAACVGTKEFVASLPTYLRLRRPDRDVVLYPAVAYPSYEMGARLAGCRPVPVAVDREWRLDLSAISPSDAERALCLWVNSPANPTGALDDLRAAAAWGQARDVPVLSDECYVEFTWDGPRRTILGRHHAGLLAVHSLSKRSNMAGVRVGFYAGDPELVAYLGEVRKHAGLMVPGPSQAAAAAALDDDHHVDAQAHRYQERLSFLADAFEQAGVRAPPPRGGFYLWVPAPGGDAWAFTEWLAVHAGVLVAPGEFYGSAGAAHVRVAVVHPMERLALAAERLAAAEGPSLGDNG